MEGTNGESSSREAQARIDAARAKREEIEARREASRKVKLLEDEVAAEERAAVEEELLEKLESEHGLVGKDLAVVQTDSGMIVLKRAHHHLYNRFVEKGKTSVEELDKLIRPSVLHPSKEQYDKLCERFPAARTQCADALVILAGVRREEAGKK